MGLLKKLTIFFVFLLLSGCTNTKKDQIKPVNIEKNIEKFTLSSILERPKVELTGTVEVEQESIISAKTNGRIRSLRINVGDRVKKGELLGELDGDELAVQLETTLTDLKVAQEIYNAQEALFEEKMKSAKNNVEIAEIELETAKESLSDLQSSNKEQISLAKAQLKQANTALANTQSSIDQRINSLYDQSVSIFRSAFTTIVGAFSFANQLLEPNDNIANSYADRYDNQIGAFDSDAKNTAKQSAQSLSVLINNMDTKWVETFLPKEEKNPISKETIDTAMEEMISFVEAAQRTVGELYIVLTNSISSWDLTEEQIEIWKNEALKHINNLEKNYNNGQGGGVFGWKVRKNEIITQNNAELSSAEINVLLAEQSLVQIEVGTQQSLTPAESRVRNAKIQLNNARVQLANIQASKTATLLELKRGISASEGNEKLIRTQLTNTKIYAPFNGVITQKNAEKGQVVAAGQGIFLLANTDIFKVETDIPDNAINFALLPKNEKELLEWKYTAYAKIDGITEPLNAKISRIDPSVDPFSRTLGVEFTLITEEAELRVGQFAELYIELPKEPAFYVPKYFVDIDFDGSYITTNQKERIAVQILGEKDNTVQIYFKGISEGQEIMSF